MTRQSDPTIPLSFTRDLPLAQAALDFARESHAGQVRGSDRAPFILHPVETASLLERSHYPDHVVAAAILHDVLEDTDTEPEELEARFGGEVSELVATVSADEEQRREDVRRRVSRAGGYAPAVYAADKVSKVRELRAMLAGGMDPAGAESKRRHYRRCLAMLEKTIPGSRLVELLRFELEALEALPPGIDGASTG